MIGLITVAVLISVSVVVLWWIVSIGIDLIGTPKQRAVRQVRAETWQTQRRVEQIARDAQAEIQRLAAEARYRR